MLPSIGEGASRFEMPLLCSTCVTCRHALAIHVPNQPAHVDDLLPRHPRAEKRIVVRDVGDPGVRKVMAVHICFLVFVVGKSPHELRLSHG